MKKMFHTYYLKSTPYYIKIYMAATYMANDQYRQSLKISEPWSKKVIGI